MVALLTLSGVSDMKEALKACGFNDDTANKLMTNNGMSMDDLLLLTHSDVKDLCDNYNDTIDKSKPGDKISLLPVIDPGIRLSAIV
jgi:hypothetical protein